MNKTHFFFLLLICFASSCSQKDSKLQDNTKNPINTVAVIIDDQLWNGEVGDSIRNKFASPVLGLPQEEPLFNLAQYPVKLFEGFNSYNRNILLIKKGVENNYELKENEFTTPQNVFHISGKSASEILETLEDKNEEITRKIRATEIALLQKTFKDSLFDTQKIKKAFGFDIMIPSKYETVVRRKKFFWIKTEFIGGNTSLLIYEVPWSRIKSKNLVNDIVRVRDSIGRKYVHGSDYGTKMITEEAYSPYFSKTALAGCKTYETKGTWQMKNDYMTGPFINYAILDRNHKRIIVLEGFCYAPSKAKRDLMMELEAIIKSIQIK